MEGVCNKRCVIQLSVSFYESPNDLSHHAGHSHTSGLQQGALPSFLYSKPSFGNAGNKKPLKFFLSDATISGGITTMLLLFSCDNLQPSQSVMCLHFPRTLSPEGIELCVFF